MTNWKNAYQDKWIEGFNRESFVKQFFEEKGFIVEENGFQAMSTSYSFNYPDEPGIPDLKIINPLTNKAIYVEVTGTTNLNDFDLIWIRPDKIEYARNHPELQIFLAHVVDKKQLLRFIFLTNVKLLTLTKIQPIIRGNRETYYTIKPKYLLNKNIFQKVK
jgi:hypothetical protein